MRSSASSGAGVKLPQFWRYQTDPAGFIREVLGYKVWPDPPLTKEERLSGVKYVYEWQIGIVESVAKHRRTAIRSCHAIGKDFTLGHLVVPWYFLSFDESIVITTAPTGRQVQLLLWGEIRAAMARIIARHPELAWLSSHVNQLDIQIDPKHYAIGFKSKDTDPEKFAGFHAPNLLYVIDEASGVSDGIFVGVEGGMSTAGSRLVMIGNPTEASGQFYRAFHEEGDLYNKIPVDRFQTPNFAPDVIKAWEEAGEPLDNFPWPAPFLIDPGYAKRQLQVWGSESPLYQAKVLGQFPEEAALSFFPLSKIELAINTPPVAYAATPPVHLGLDVARFGDDMTVLTARQGDNWINQEQWAKRELTFSAHRAAAVIRKLLARKIRIDTIGLGAGVFARLCEMRDTEERDANGDRLVPPDLEVVSVNVSEKPLDEEHYRSRRDEIYDSFRQRLVAGNVAGMPDDPVLVSEMAGIQYRYNARGQLEIESKDDMKKRIQRSPDHLESAIFAYLGDDTPLRIDETIPPEEQIFGNIWEKVF